MLALERRRPLLLVALLALASLTGACAAASPMRVPMEPLAAAKEAPAPLEEDYFKRDAVGAISEDQLRAILKAPVYLEEAQRVGIVQVSTGYAVDEDLPTTATPAVLAKTLADSSFFQVVSEVSTDWPASGHIAGLRELAARYRCGYLLLYRHRFLDRSYTNAWALGWLTVVGAFFVPHNTIEVSGVVEATLFDVRTGTLLFTVFERVHHASEENLWQNDRKRRAMKEQLLAEAAKKLADDVLTKTQDLVAARPRPAAPVARPAAPPVTTPPVAGGGEPGLRIVAPLAAGEAGGAAAP